MITQVAFSPDGRQIAANGDTTIQQWDAESGQPMPPLVGTGRGPYHFGYVDGGRIVITASDGAVQVLDVNTGKPVQPPAQIQLPTPSDTLGHSFAFSSDGRRIGSGTDTGIDATVQQWDVKTGRALGRPMRVRPNQVIQLAFSPDGRHLAASYQDGLRLWNTDTTQLEGSVMNSPGSLAYFSVAFSRDGKTIAAGRADGALELWDVDTRKRLPGSPFHGHKAGIGSVAFGPDHQLASGAADATLRLWNIPKGQPMAAPQTASSTVTSVALSPDGRLAAWGRFDGTMLLSPAMADPGQLCDKLSANISKEHWRQWVSPGIDYITVCPKLPPAQG